MNIPDWIYEYVSMLFLGTVLAVSLLKGIPVRILKILGAIPYCSPNWISVIRCPITLLGLILFITAEGSRVRLWLGLSIAVVGFALDNVDGKVADALTSRLAFLHDTYVVKSRQAMISLIVPADPAQVKAVTPPPGSFWAWYKTSLKNQPKKHPPTDDVEQYKRVIIEPWLYNLLPSGTKMPMFVLTPSKIIGKPGLILSLSGLGQWIDPLADKVIMLPILLVIALQGYAQLSAVTLVIVLDIISTLIRPPFHKIALIAYLQAKWVGEVKASAYGKTKAACQILVLLAVMPATAGWLSHTGLEISGYLVNSLLWVSVVTGTLSILSRLKIWQQYAARLGLERFNRSFKKLYQHDV